MFFPFSRFFLCICRQKGTRNVDEDEKNCDIIKIFFSFFQLRFPKEAENVHLVDHPQSQIRIPARLGFCERGSLNNNTLFLNLMNLKRFIVLLVSLSTLCFNYVYSFDDYCFVNRLIRGCLTWKPQTTQTMNNHFSSWRLFWICRMWRNRPTCKNNCKKLTFYKTKMIDW